MVVVVGLGVIVLVVTPFINVDNFEEVDIEVDIAVDDETDFDEVEEVILELVKLLDSVEFDVIMVIFKDVTFVRFTVIKPVGIVVIEVVVGKVELDEVIFEDVEAPETTEVTFVVGLLMILVEFVFIEVLVDIEEIVVELVENLVVAFVEVVVDGNFVLVVVEFDTIVLVEIKLERLVEVELELESPPPPPSGA